MNVLELDIEPPENLIEIFESSEPSAFIDPETYYAIKDSHPWREYLDEWARKTFHVENIYSRLHFSFLFIPAGRDTEFHVDLIKGNMQNGREPHRQPDYHMRLCAINIPIPYPDICGCYEYIDQDTGEYKEHEIEGPALYRTDIMHRGSNKYGTSDRLLFGIGFYEDSFDKIKEFHRLGIFLRNKE